MATGTGKTTTALEITRQLILRGEINKIIISATEKERFYINGLMSYMNGLIHLIIKI